MAITQTLATSFKQELALAYHNFGTGPVRASAAADTFKLALYTSSATLDSTTTVYTTSNEVPASGGYSAGGGTLVIAVAPTTSGTTAMLGFSDLTFTSTTISGAYGAMIYNSSQGNRTVGILNFGSSKSVTAGNFTVQFPSTDSTSAIIRIA